MKNLAVVIFLSSIFLAACNEDSDDELPAGGPCTYKELRSSLTVAKVITINGNGDCDILFTWTENAASKDADSISYFNINQRLVSADEIKKDSIKTGSSCTFVYQQPLTGSCDRQERIELVRFK